MRKWFLCLAWLLVVPLAVAVPKQVQDGFRAFYLHQWGKALKLAREAHRADPGNIDAFWLEALCHLHDRNYREARRTAEAALKVAGNAEERAYANYLLAEGWMWEDVVQADLLVEQKVIPKRIPGHTHACTSAAWYYVKRGDGARSLKLMDAAFPFLAEDFKPSAYDTRGAALILLGRYKEAWVDLERAFNVYKSPNLLFHRGQCLEELKRPQEALRSYRQSLVQGGWHEFEESARQRIKALEKRR